MTENRRKSNFELMDEMEKKQRLQAKDETYVDPKPDGIRYIRKMHWIRPDAELTFPSVALGGWFALWLTSLIPNASWLGDLCMIVVGVGVVGSIRELFFKKKNN